MRGIFKTLTPLIKPLVFWGVLGILLSSITLLSNIALLALSGWFMTAMGLAGISGLAINYFTPAAAIRAFAIMRTTSRYAERVVSHDAIFRFIAVFRPWFYAALEKLPIHKLEKLSGGDLFDRLRHDIALVEQAYTALAVPVIAALLSILAVTAGFYIYNPQLAVTLFVMLFLAGFIIPYAVLRASRKPVAQREGMEKEMKDHMVDALAGLPELLAFGAEAEMLSRQNKYRENIFRQRLALHRHALLADAGIQILTGLCILAALFIGYTVLHNGGMGLATFAMLPLAAIACFEIIVPLPAAFQVFDHTRMAFARLLEFSQASQKEERIANLETVDFSIHAHKISFGYNPARLLFQDFTLHLTKGEQIAILGPTGCGKSTLLSLLTGQRQPTDGHILIHGHDTALFCEDTFFPLFSIAPQKPFLFADTLRRNLILAKPDATDDELDAACRLAGFDEVLTGLPKGYDTFIGTNGMTLSGGQLRRLSLARALLNEAPCLLLDEPDEGLDAQQAHDILSRICAYARQKNISLILISHKDLQGMKIDRTYKLAATYKR